jgi:putative endonuclease
MSYQPRRYYVFIMGSLSGTLYIDLTNNLHGRVFQHKFHRVQGFTDKYGVERLLYWESFDEVAKAINREKQLKGWSRAKKIALIESLNPQWVDLAKEWYPWMGELSDGKVRAGNRGPSTPQPDSRMRIPLLRSG